MILLRAHWEWEAFTKELGLLTALGSAKKEGVFSLLPCSYGFSEHFDHMEMADMAYCTVHFMPSSHCILFKMQHSMIDYRAKREP